MAKYQLNRDVNISECDWLKRDFKKGEPVYGYYGATYGVISYSGRACTLDKNGRGEFFELPVDALDVVAN